MKMLCTASMAAFLVATAGVTTAQATPEGSGMKLSQAECGSLWSRADAAGAGALSSADAQGYVSDFSAVDANADGSISAAEFMDGCANGLIHDSAGTGAGEGASGADKAPGSDSKSRPDY